MEVTEKKVVTRKAKKTPFGKVEEILKHDGTPREIDPKSCYFYAEDVVVNTGKKQITIPMLPVKLRSSR